MSYLQCNAVMWSLPGFFHECLSREFVWWEGGVRTCAQDRSKQKRTAAKAISSIVDALENGAGELAPVAVCCGCRHSVVSGSVGGVNILVFFFSCGRPQRRVAWVAE